MAEELENVPELQAQVNALKTQLDLLGETLNARIDEIAGMLGELAMSNDERSKEVEAIASALSTGGLTVNGDADISGTLSVGEHIRGPLAAKSVDNAEIADNAITAVKIRDGEVGTNELANGAVTAAKIGGGQVGTNELANNAVTAAKIRDGQVGTNELANNAVTAAKIGDGQVGTNELANNAVTAAKIKNGQVGRNEIANNAVNNDKLANKALTAITGTGEGAFSIRCHDLKIGGKRSPNLRRALVDHADRLTVNWENDWPKVVINGREVVIKNLANGSSRSFKDDIDDVPLITAREVLAGLRPRLYRMRADDGRQLRFGFIAEETPLCCATPEQDAIYLDGILSALVAVVRDLDQRLPAVK